MALLQLIHVKKLFGDVEILQDVDTRVVTESRIGLLGVNGAGKTTLFKIILGILEPDSGQVISRNGLRVHYLPQTPALDLDSSVYQEALKSFSELIEMERQLEEFQQKMAETEGVELDEIIAEHDQLIVKFDEAGGYRYRGRTESVLLALAFTREMFDLEVSKLSGGQKNRLALARLLLTQADLLLMDEPTNFLDIPTIEWLEEELLQKNCAFVIISHDRYFLDNIAGEIWELEDGVATCYKGNFSKYQIEKEKRLEQLAKSYEQQQAEIKRQEDFIRRNIYGQKHRQAQSRRKMLAKMEKIDAPSKDQAKMSLNLSPSSSGSNVVVEVQNLGHQFGQKQLFSSLDFSLYSEDKMAIIGPNGCGKSTLLHIIIGRLAPTSGKVILGQKNILGFYHQELVDLDLEITVFDSIKNLVPTMDDGPLRSFLARFLFHGDDVYKQVSSLSGGERSKLALARLMIQRPNFLVLDEPTNHLDIASRDILEEALSTYEGTLLFTSHDRYFINRIATRLLVYHEQKWIDFHGNYDLYVSSREQVIPAPKNEQKLAKKKGGMARPLQKKAKKRYTLEQLEEKIITAETRQQELLEHMSSPEVCRDAAKMKTCKEEYEQLTQTLGELNEEWESWG